jgi:putative phosphoesterase
LLRPAAVDALRGSDLIVHAGDIGSAAILRELATLAPVTAVRGNNDVGAWASDLRDVETIELAAARIGVVHDVKTLAAARGRGWNAVVAGHSHRPLCKMCDGVLHFNPGSAGPRRFSLPVCVGEIVVDGDALEGRIIELSA